ncbi:MAG: hypothetical protein KatS3mg079_637 [Caloramator sp.]|nr:MAG: hypothetical protein KatS3mg079_637 [Caloramator sp.]
MTKIYIYESVYERKRGTRYRVRYLYVFTSTSTVRNGLCCIIWERSIEEEKEVVAIGPITAEDAKKKNGVEC